MIFLNRIGDKPNFQTFNGKFKVKIKFNKCKIKVDIFNFICYNVNVDKQKEIKNDNNF